MAKLILPSKKYIDSARAAMKERYKFGEITKKDLQEELELMADPGTYVKNILDKRKSVGLKAGQVPLTRYWLIHDGEYIGTLGLRHKTTKKTRDREGNMGYHIRPSKRNKGYGTEALRLGLLKAKSIGLKSVYINCLKNNIASIRIVEKNGGVQRDKKMKVVDNSGSVHYIIKLT